VQIITRNWTIRPSGSRVHVLVRHPECGDLPRGVITHLRSQGMFPRWGVTDYDHHNLGEVTGDYLDAEQLLLDATAELDESTTPHTITAR